MLTTITLAATNTIERTSGRVPSRANRSPAASIASAESASMSVTIAAGRAAVNARELLGRNVDSIVERLHQQREAECGRVRGERR